MGKLLKLILITQLIGWMSSIISKLYTQPIVLLIAFAANILVWVGLWKGTSYVVNNPEERTVPNKKANFLRWIILFVFSIFAVEIGTLFSEIFRIFIDRAYLNENSLLASLATGTGANLDKIIIIFGLLLSFPLIIFISKSLKFNMPIKSSIISTLGWALLIFVAGPLFMV